MSLIVYKNLLKICTIKELNMIKGEHYLPKFYLERFSNNGKISVLNILNNNIIHTNVEKIGKKNYFYDLNPQELKNILSEYKKKILTLLHYNLMI